MRTSFLILLIATSTLTGFTQPNSPYSFSLLTRTLFQPQANVGHQLGVQVQKQLQNDKTALQLSFFRSLNKIDSDAGLGYTIFHMTYLSFGVNQQLAKIGTVEIRGHLALDLGGSEQRIRVYPDLETYSPYAVFALEPGIRAEVPIGNRGALYTGTAYLLQFSELFPSEGLQSVAFNRPVWDIGITWKL